MKFRLLNYLSSASSLSPITFSAFLGVQLLPIPTKGSVRVPPILRNPGFKTHSSFITYTAFTYLPTVTSRTWK